MKNYLEKYFYKNIHIYQFFLKYFYKNKMLKLCFGDYVVILNDF
jgi:hypothetical protein